MKNVQLPHVLLYSPPSRPNDLVAREHLKFYHGHGFYFVVEALPVDYMARFRVKVYHVDAYKTEEIGNTWTSHMFTARHAAKRIRNKYVARFLQHQVGGEV